MPRKQDTETRAKKYMTLLGISYDEAIQMVKDDDIIDNGGKCDWEVELTPEQKKIVRRARMADREVNKEKVKRARKEDTDKKDIMTALCNAIYALDENYEVTNAEREIEFTMNGRKFKVTLSAPRAPKE